MYFPSMLFGGSSFIHLLASHPRVVALFGIGALLSTILWSPFGTPNVPGASGQLAVLEQRARAAGPDTLVIQRAQESARLIAQRETPARLAEIVENTLRQCGVACTGVTRSSVLADERLLNDVLLLHTLEQAHRSGAAQRSATVGPPAGSQ